MARDLIIRPWAGRNENTVHNLLNCRFWKQLQGMRKSMGKRSDQLIGRLVTIRSS